MIKRTRYAAYILLVLQAFLPAITLCALVLGWNLKLLHAEIYAITLAVLSLIVVICGLGEIGKTGKVCLSLALPLSMINFIMLSAGHGALTIIALGVNTVCCVVAYSFGKGMRTLRIFTTVVSGLLIPVVAAWMFFAVFMSDFTVTTVERSEDSPDGRFSARVMYVDQGALGGDYVARVYRNELMGIPLDGIITLDRKVWIGDNTAALSIRWEDDDTLIVNGVEHDFR